MSPDKFQARINYQGEMEPFLTKAGINFGLGRMKGYWVITQGYEDFNLVVDFDYRVFVKVFAKTRDPQEVPYLIGVLSQVEQVGVQAPRLYKSPAGYLQEVTMGAEKDLVVVMEYITGANLYQSNSTLTVDEKKVLIQQAALINGLTVVPGPIYDGWSIVNFLAEYQKKQQHLNTQDRGLVDPLIGPFAQLDIRGLPHSLVHGDIIKTNVIKDASGKLYIVDFSVANYYPRIQELAVMLNSTLFNEEDIKGYQADYDLALSEYQKYITLTQKEQAALPLFVQVGHAMHLISAQWEKEANYNDSQENEYWIKLGRIGLQFTQTMWGA